MVDGGSGTSRASGSSTIASRPSSEPMREGALDFFTVVLVCFEDEE